MRSQYVVMVTSVLETSVLIGPFKTFEQATAYAQEKRKADVIEVFRPSREQVIENEGTQDS